MTADARVAPFSARNRGRHVRIDGDFPYNGRIALNHLLSDLIGRQYISGWAAIANELERISRHHRTDYTFSPDPEGDAKSLVMRMEWEGVYDFCERLYSRFAVSVGYVQDGEYVETTSKADVQQYIESEIQLLFEEEGLAFEFREGIVQRRGRRHSVDQISKAQVVLGDPKLNRARGHYAKALQYFRDAKKPDPENAVKEAVCAVEAAAKTLFPDVKASTLDGVIQAISGSAEGQIPKAIAKTFLGLYGFRGSGDGVAHGGSDGGRATNQIAEFALAVAASQIILLVDLASVDETDIPF